MERVRETACGNVSLGRGRQGDDLVNQVRPMLLSNSIRAGAVSLTDLTLAVRVAR